MSRTTLRLAVVAAAAASTCLTLVVAEKLLVHGFFDLRVYRGAVMWWLHGRSLYSFHTGRGEYGFTYPPFAAAFMVPLAWVTFRTAVVLTTLASAVAVVAITWRLVAPAARRHGWTPWFAVALAVPVVLAMDPIRITFGYGQVNMLIFAMVLLDVVALRRGWAWGGAAIGLATAIKLTPGLFIVFLVLIGRRRAAAVATGTFLGATLLGLVVDGAASWQYWTHALWDTSRVGQLDKPANQSLLGMLAHVADPGQPDRRVWAVLAGAALVVGMWRAVRAYRCGDDLVAVTLVGLTACLVSPISWTHHLYWVVPAVVVLLDVAAGTPLHGPSSEWWRRRARVVAAGAGVLALVVAVLFILDMPGEFLPPAGAAPGRAPAEILGSAYTFIVLALVALLPARRTVAVEGGDEAVDEPLGLERPGSAGRHPA
ncbi:glycosyltransferase 87 family protein [Geodermatophilus ruber]|uniref:glycosyltransferase 87 family protein n=1 Tax=Geodermatophilus ruber TaxID=504800 RepID=UPI0015A630C2|nr:glycosyltransferase 87 family protein [Geodermatophilus ruber]